MAPIRHLLALQVMKILFSPRFWWSIETRQPLPRTSPLIALKANWCSAVHMEKEPLHWFFVNGVRIVGCSASTGRNVLMYRTNPRNCHTCFADFSACQFSTFSTFDPSASIPLSEI